MSVDPDHIDLNSRVVGSVGQEKEVSVSEPVLAETLTDSVPGQAQVQEQVVDGVGKNREMDSIEEVSGAGNDSGSVEKAGCDKVEILSLARCSSMEVGDGESVDGKENGVSEIVEEGKPMEIETLAEVVDEISVKKSPEISFPQGCDKVKILSLARCSSMEVGDGASVNGKEVRVSEIVEEGKPMKSETLTEVVDGISVKKSPDVSSPQKDVDVSAGADGDVSFNQLVQEIDSPPEKRRTQIKDSQSSGELSAQSGSRSTSVDHDMSMDGDLSCDVEASSDASKPRFVISDLVWAKVMSYPWWPGQIFDPSDASATAKKMSKKGAYLVAYFGDDTFAWNNESKIKPFSTHFSLMEKQSNSAEFRNAVDCALEEASRRTELSLSCSCTSKVESQEEATEGVGDYSFSSASVFKPLQLIEFVRALAPSPLYDAVDKLQLVTSQAQLLAFHHWKGYPELPRFEVLHGTVEGAAGIPPSEEGKQSKEVNGGAAHVPSVESGDKMPSGDCVTGSKDPSLCKRKNALAGDIASGKKEKSLSELIAEAKLNLKNAKKGPNSKPGIKYKSVSSGGKRKGSDTADDDWTPKRMKSSSPTSADDPPQSKQSFRVGASILRVASQLACASSVLKNGDGNATKSAVKNKKQRKKET